MNDLKELWKENGNGKDLLEQIIKSNSYKNQSQKSPLSKLKRNLTINLVYGVAITFGYAFIVFYFPIWQVQACMILLIGFNLWAIKKAWVLYKQVEMSLLDENVLSSLKKVYHTFKAWEGQIQRIGLLVYPFAATGGFMLGGTVGSGKTVEAFMADYRVLIILAFALMVLVPLCYFLAKWMNNIAFGQYITQIKHRIEELEAQG